MGRAPRRRGRSFGRGEAGRQGRRLPGAGPGCRQRPAGRRVYRRRYPGVCLCWPEPAGLNQTTTHQRRARGRRPSGPALFCLFDSYDPHGVFSHADWPDFQVNKPCLTPRSTRCRVKTTGRIAARARTRWTWNSINNSSSDCASAIIGAMASAPPTARPWRTQAASKAGIQHSRGTRALSRDSQALCERGASDWLTLMHPHHRHADRKHQPRYRFGHRHRRRHAHLPAHGLGPCHGIRHRHARPRDYRRSRRGPWRCRWPFAWSRPRCTLSSRPLAPPRPPSSTTRRPPSGTLPSRSRAALRAGWATRATRSPPTLIAGVAVATALMPPLCAAGYGIAIASGSLFLSAPVRVRHQRGLYHRAGGRSRIASFACTAQARPQRRRHCDCRGRCRGRRAVAQGAPPHHCGHGGLCHPLHRHDGGVHWLGAGRRAGRLRRDRNHARACGGAAGL